MTSNANNSACGGSPFTSISLKAGLIGAATPTGDFGFNAVDKVTIPFDSIPTPRSTGPDVIETGAVSRYYLLINDQ